MNKLWAGIISIFPNMFDALQYGMPGKAILQQQLELALFNPRDYTDNTHQTVDDRPFGGGPGMVMMLEPLKKALNAAKKSSPFAPKVIYLSPTGKRFDHNAAVELSKTQALVFVAGRYEGIDQRFIDTVVDEEWSVGDYVTSGGELPIMIMIDSIIRQLPGVLGHEQSAECDSFANGLLDCPHYTRPEVIEGLAVPEVLKSGNHAAIARWRLKQSLGITWLKRPDLLAQKVLTEEEQRLLTEFKDDWTQANSSA
jgi:tRNA (guanine37-N1)-methyltransferase